MIRYQLDQINKALSRLSQQSEAIGADLHTAIRRMQGCGLDAFVHSTAPKSIGDREALEAARTYSFYEDLKRADGSQMKKSLRLITDEFREFLQAHEVVRRHINKKRGWLPHDHWLAEDMFSDGKWHTAFISHHRNLDPSFPYESYPVVRS